MTEAERTQPQAIPSTLPAMPGDEALRARIESEAEAVLVLRGHDDAKTTAAEIAQALVEGLHLHASTVFVKPGAPSRPEEPFRTVTGRMDEPEAS